MAGWNRNDVMIAAQLDSVTRNNSKCVKGFEKDNLEMRKNYAFELWLVIYSILSSSNLIISHMPPIYILIYVQMYEALCQH